MKKVYLICSVLFLTVQLSSCQSNNGEKSNLTRCAFRRKIKKLFIESLKSVYLIDYQLIKYYEQLYSKL